MSEVVKMEFFSNIKSSLWGQVGYSTLTGLFGTLLLVLFLTGLMPLGATLKYLPWILGFNASVAGYTLMDRAGNKLQHKKPAGLGVGFLVAALTCNLLNLLTLKMTGMPLMGWPEMLSFIIIASLLGGFGAWLALKYASIKGR